MKKVTVEELLKKALEPSENAPRLHKFYKGKVGVSVKCRIRDFNDFAIWYTPGVAAVCKEIAQDPDKAYDYTNKWNNVAVISDGTRVLGLGDIGPLGGLPVMEGKGLLYKYLGGVDAFPICLDEKDPDKIIEICNVKNAKLALDADSLVGLMMPCKINVFTQAGKTMVSLLRPSLLATFFPGAGLEAMSADVELALTQIADAARD